MLESSAIRNQVTDVFEAAFECAATGMLFLAPDLSIVHANRALATMLDQCCEDLPGLDAVQLVEPEDRDAFCALFRRLSAKPGAAMVDARLLRRCRGSLWMRIEAASVPAPSGFVLQLRDMTIPRQLHLQHALMVEVFGILDRAKDPVEAARLILAATRQALGIEAAAIRLAREGDFTYVAHEGFPDEFIAAENCLRALDEKGQLLSDEQGQPVLECTCGQVLMGRTDPQNPFFTASGCVCVNDACASNGANLVDLRVHPRDRCLHSGYRSVALIPIRSRQNIIGLLQLNDHRPNQFPPDRVAFLEGIASFVGIALERKQAQDRLARSYELLTQAHAATKSGQWSWDLRRNLVEWSDSHYSLVGLKPFEIKPSLQTWMAMVHPEDRQHVQEAIEAARFAAGPIDLEWRSILPDGNVRWLMSRCHIEKDSSGAPVRYTGITLDITERKAAEERRRELERTVNHLQRLESLGRLARGVAHDMNNVLGVIMSIGSFLQDNDDPAIVEDAERLVRAAARGRDMVKGLRDFSRKELQSASEMDLNEIATHEADLVQRTCLKPIVVKLELDPDLPTVYGEGTSIENAVMNLCGNALDAMPNQGTLTVRTKRMGSDFVELSVEDDGEGMPPAVVARALEPFFTTKAPGKGTGLGLSQVYGTMKAHGGTVNVESTLGKGTRVRLTFPVMEKVLGMRAGDSTTPAPSHFLNVLVVDDESSLREPMLNLLKSLGHTGQGVPDGLEALAKLKEKTPVDMVILDLNMPGLDAVDILGRMRSLRPDLPILVAVSCTDERMPALLACFTGVHALVRPFGRRELAEAISALRVASR